MKKDKEIASFTKRYCCLYHFTTGKQQKDSSPCFNHVALGVINPLPSTFPRQTNPTPQNIKVASKAYQINFHTHDLNQIENKASLPKRLAYPRVYVEQLRHKNSQQNSNTIAGFQAFLKGTQFQQIFDLFKAFVKVAHFSSQEQLLKSIRAYGLKNSIFSKQDKQSTTSNQLLFSHQNFVSYLSELGFQDSFAEQFWRVAFNRSRFKDMKNKKLPKEDDVISMKAFAYNFKKFYLDQLLSYKNCLSQPAFRQRMIDLRLFLNNWFERNIILKQNYLSWKQIQFQICTQLKRYEQDKLYVQLITLIERRNKIWLFMRTLAKILYKETDKKNLGLDLLNKRATEYIEKKRLNLQIFFQFVNHFQTVLLSKDISKEQKFKITDLVIQAKSPKFIIHIQQITCSLRGLFKYLYFFKNNPHLQLNYESLNLDCSSLIEINLSQLFQYLSFKRKESNQSIQMVEAICKEINDTVDARPEISGNKRFLNQCNFVAESLLKMIRKCDFDVFYRLQRIRELFSKGDIADLQKLKQIMEGESNRDLSIRSQFWKRMFSFQASKQKLSQSNLSSRVQPEGKDYIIALQQYHKLREKLQGKLSSFDQSKINGKIQKYKPPKQQKEEIKSSVLNPSQTVKEELQEVKMTESVLEGKHKCGTSTYCSLCDELCNTDVNSELSKIDEMSGYLMDLLGFT